MLEFNKLLERFQNLTVRSAMGEESYVEAEKVKNLLDAKITELQAGYDLAAAWCKAREALSIAEENLRIFYKGRISNL